VTDNAIIKQEQAPMAPMQMIQVAFQKALEAGGAEALAVADRILEQMAKQRDYEDRDAFNAALRRVQDKIKPIVKDCENKQTRSRYASAEAIDNMIDKLIEDEGMTLSFVPKVSDKDNEFIVVGVLSLGAYSKEYPLPIPCDGKGPKGDGVMSRVQAVGNGVSYAKRYIKNMIFNLRFKEKDDDGNRAGGKQPGVLDEREQLTHLDNIRNANDAEELRKMYMAAQKAADATGDTKSTIAFASEKNKRYRELQAEGRI
jgi:predicted transcriptional regulator